MGKIRIDMLGANFTLQADNGNDEYLQKLLGYYKGITDELENCGIKNPIQVAILAGINLCDELYKEKENKIALENGKLPSGTSNNSTDNSNNVDNAEIIRRTKEMISKIDKVL